MTVTPETDDRLLLRIRDARDREAWYEFVEIYRPLIYRVGRRHGLQDADAQNLVQAVLHKVHCQIENWQTQQSAGGFRRWLTTVARHAAIDAIRRIRPDAGRGGTSVIRQLNEIVDGDAPVRSNLEAEMEMTIELEREAFRRAAKAIRHEFSESTWMAFWKTMVDGQSCSQVASELEKSVGAIYTARSRVMRRLKDEVNRFPWSHHRNDDWSENQC